MRSHCLPSTWKRNWSSRDNCDARVTLVALRVTPFPRPARPVSPVGDDARPSNGKARVRSPHRPPRVRRAWRNWQTQCAISFPCHTLPVQGRRSRVIGRSDRKVVHVRVLPLLHTRDRNLTGDEAHGEHDNTHDHNLPHGADGCGLSPVKREVRVRVPASSTVSPPRTGRSEWVTASKRPNRSSLPVRPMHLGDVAHIGRALRSSFAAHLPC